MDRRTSKVAVAALVLGLLGVSLYAGVTAIILGIISLCRLVKSGGRLGGGTMAGVGIGLALMIPLLLGPGWRPREISPEYLCRSSLAGIGKAILIYANDFDDELPTPSKWCDILVRTGRVDPAALQCAGVRRPPTWPLYPIEHYLYRQWKHSEYLRGEGACDFAMNRDVAACGTSGPPGPVLLFESRPGWNQLGGPESIATDHHDGASCNVMFLDTHVEFVKTEDLDGLRWKP